MILQLKNPIDVETPLGYGKCIAWIDYGTDVNTVWKVVLYESGIVRNFYDDDILVYPNKMDGGELDKSYFTKDVPSVQQFFKQIKNTKNVSGD